MMERERRRTAGAVREQRHSDSGGGSEKPGRETIQRLTLPPQSPKRKPEIRMGDSLSGFPTDGQMPVLTEALCPFEDAGLRLNGKESTLPMGGQGLLGICKSG